jgi:type II secretory pathway component GspD/PulD (secretin)
MRLPLCLVVLLGFGLPLSAAEPATKAPPASTRFGTDCELPPLPPNEVGIARIKDSWDPHDAPQKTMTSFVHHLEHGTAAKVASQVSSALQQVHCLDGAKNGLVVDSPVVIVPDAASNSLVVAASAEYIEEIREQIAKADTAPRQYHVRILLKSKDGTKQHVIMRPQIATLEGQPAAIAVRTADG